MHNYHFPAMPRWVQWGNYFIVLFLLAGIVVLLTNPELAKEAG